MEEKQEKKKRRQFTETFKLEVLREMHESGRSKYAIAKKYDIAPVVIRGWEKRYEIPQKLLSLPAQEIEYQMRKSKETLQDEVSELKKKLHETEKALEFEKLRSHAYEVLIEIAEREEGVTIKKDGAKQ